MTQGFYFHCSKLPGTLCQSVFNSTIYPHTNSNNTLYRSLLNCTYSHLVLYCWTRFTHSLAFLKIFFLQNFTQRKKLSVKQSLRVRNHLSVGFCASVLLSSQKFHSLAPFGAHTTRLSCLSSSRSWLFFLNNAVLFQEHNLPTSQANHLWPTGNGLPTEKHTSRASLITYYIIFNQLLRNWKDTRIV